MSDELVVTCAEAHPAVLRLRGLFSRALPAGVPFVTVFHEAAHAVLLGLEPPWDSVEIDRLLSLMRSARRVREEVRAGLVGGLAGAAHGLPFDPVRGAAATGAIALLNERQHHGDVAGIVSVTMSLVDDVTAGAGPTLDELRGLMPRTLRLARRERRRPKVRAAVRALAALSGAAP